MADKGPVEPGVFDLVEDGVRLLQGLGWAAYPGYAAGTLAFLWALLAFFSHMSRNALAPERLAEYAGLVALAFLAMKACHAAFFTSLMDALHGEAPAPLSWRRAARLFASQAMVQPFALFLLPAAAVLTVPFPWVSAFFQNAQWVAPGEGFREGWARAARMARLWPLQNVLLQAFFLAAGLCCAVNIAVACLAVPQLLKSLLGIDTVFSRGAHAFLNTTFLLAVVGLAWAAVDPLVKAVHALRCFRGESLRTGRDLRLALRRAAGEEGRKAGIPRAAAAMLALGLALAAPASAQPAAPRSAAASAQAAQAAEGAAGLSPAEYDALLREEIAGSRYAWRLPRDSEARQDHPGLVARWLKKAAGWIKASLKRSFGWVRRLVRWLDSLFKRDGAQEAGERGGGAPASLTIKVLLGALLASVIGLGLMLLFRRRKEEAPPAAAAAASPAAPDLAGDDVRPDALPEDEWLRLVEDLRAKGEERLALRALFLALLAVAARQEWLVVARAKSNRDYLREVSLRSRRDPAIAEGFRECCRRFERAWYGRHPVTAEDWDVSRAHFDKVAGHAG